MSQSLPDTPSAIKEQGWSIAIYRYVHSDLGGISDGSGQLIIFFKNLFNRASTVEEGSSKDSEIDFVKQSAWKILLQTQAVDSAAATGSLSSTRYCASGWFISVGQLVLGQNLGTICRFYNQILLSGTFAGHALSHFLS